MKRFCNNCNKDVEIEKRGDSDLVDLSKSLLCIFTLGLAFNPNDNNEKFYFYCVECNHKI